eukprot:scaffold4040_cov287-Ochromonas_danica.AAC.3
MPLTMYIFSTDLKLIDRLRRCVERQCRCPCDVQTRFPESGLPCALATLDNKSLQVFPSRRSLTTKAGHEDHQFRPVPSPHQ